MTLFNPTKEFLIFLQKNPAIRAKIAALPNAIGTVSFCVGSGVTSPEKVFAATELHVLLRNPKVDAVTKDVLAYYLRCLQNRQSAVNFGFIGS